MKPLKANGKTLRLPAFSPDATNAFVRGVDSKDLEAAGMRSIMVNSFHLLRLGIINTISSAGGIHRFMSWGGLVSSDSGGFQIMSLIRDSPKAGSISNNRIIFKDPDIGKVILTPRKAIETQFRIGSDIMFCLDDCTRPGDGEEEQEKSVERTVKWAKECRDAFDRLSPGKDGPLLFAVIQGGDSRGLRERCASSLKEIGFDGYGFGGFPVDDKGRLLHEILDYTASLMPDNLPKFALGIGKPSDIRACHSMGYNMFDCAIPTRDARNGRLHTGGGYVYITDKKNIKDSRPIDEGCDCLLCKNYSKAYLYNLFRRKDASSVRLASIHNLRHYSRLMEGL